MKSFLFLVVLFPTCVLAQSITDKAIADSTWGYWHDQTDHHLPIVRSLALGNLSRFPENADRAAPLIFQRLKDEQEKYMRVEIIAALGRCGIYGNEQTRVTVANLMLDLLKSPVETEQVKEIALNSVLKSRDSRAMPLLCDMLNSDSDKQVLFALTQLASFNDRFVEGQVLRSFQNSCQNKKMELSLAALVTLSKIGTESSVQPLLAMVRTNNYVRSEIIATLDTIHPSIGTESLAAILEAERLEKERLVAIEAERRAQEIAERTRRAQEERARQAQLIADAKEREDLIAAWDRWEAEEKKAAIEGSKACIRSAKSKEAIYFKNFCRIFATKIADGRKAIPTNARPSMKITEDLISPLFASLEFGFKGISEDENQAWYYEFKLSEDESMWEISIFKITGTTGISKAAEPWMIDACVDANLEAGRLHPNYRAPAGKPTKPRPVK